MLELNASAFYQACDRLAEISSFVHASGKDENSLFYEERKLEAEDKIFVKSRIGHLIEHLEVLGTSVTIMATISLNHFLELDDVTWGGLQRRMDEVRNRLKDELTLCKVLTVEAGRHRYLQPAEPLFGIDFSTKFTTDAAFELDEAAKCFALGRPTASAFHLMRLMEIGIRAVTRCLQIPDPTRGDRNWGHMLREIKKDLDAHGGQSPTKTWARTGDREFFDSVYVSLDAVRVAWRNPTMHVENKYTDDEAEHIFAAVKGFMSRLASRCDENGDPKA